MFHQTAQESYKIALFQTNRSHRCHFQSYHTKSRSILKFSTILKGWNQRNCESVKNHINGIVSKSPNLDYGKSLKIKEMYMSKRSHRVNSWSILKISKAPTAWIPPLSTDSVITRKYKPFSLLICKKSNRSPYPRIFNSFSWCCFIWCLWVSSHYEMMHLQWRVFFSQHTVSDFISFNPLSWNENYTLLKICSSTFFLLVFVGLSCQEAHKNNWKKSLSASVVQQ